MRFPAALLLVIAPCAQALEAGDMLGLDVQVETLPGPVRVDGVPFEIFHARGVDVPQLASRVAARWRRQGGATQRLQQRGWQLLVRWEKGRSEVLQWRGEGVAAELLFSRLDTVHVPARPGNGPFVLPPGCAWGRTIESGSRVQRTAVCRRAAADLQRPLRTALEAQGWVIEKDLAATLEVARGPLQAQITLTPASQAGQSALVWMGAGG